VKIPVRECAACREHFEKRQLLRIVRKPDGEIVADEKGKVPGRGVYICKNEKCLEKAIKTNAFARALGAPLPAETAEELRRMIKEYRDG
jgi:predicted RNA-binding protein YlxR (DUF448 family)